jgi:outer membrane immunogenic protein
MKRLLLAAAAITFAMGSATAADMRVKAPAPVPPPVYSWTGLYVGGDVGWAQERQTATWVNSAPLTTVFNHNHSNIAGGGFAGAQVQYQFIVIGAEGNFLLAPDGTLTQGSPQSGCPNTAFACQAGVSAVWTGGGRLGLAWNSWLLYGTGGYASGTVRTRSNAIATGVVFDDFSQIKNGWFAGGGVDYMLFPHTILGIDYKHIDLGTAVMSSPADGFSLAGVNRRDIRTTLDVVTGRISFLLNDRP